MSHERRVVMILTLNSPSFFVAAARLVSLLPSYATDKINEGPSGGKLGGQSCGRVRSAKVLGNQSWVF